MEKKLLRILDYLNFKFKPDYIEIKFEEDFIYKITLKDNLYNGYKKYCYFNLIFFNKNKLDITYKNFNIKNFSNDFKKWNIK